jgi:hypothetical protein
MLMRLKKMSSMQKLVHQRGFAMVYVSDNCNIPDFLSVHTPSVPNFNLRAQRYGKISRRARKLFPAEHADSRRVGARIDGDAWKILYLSKFIFYPKIKQCQRKTSRDSALNCHGLKAVAIERNIKMGFSPNGEYMKITRLVSHIVL